MALASQMTHVVEFPAVTVATIKTTIFLLLFIC